jgi:hypothetical protein
MVSHDFFEGFWYSTFSLQPIVYPPDLKKTLNFVNQNNNEVKNNKKQASDRIEPLKIKESNNNFNADYHGLYPYDSEQNYQGGKKSSGFLKTRHDISGNELVSHHLFIFVLIFKRLLSRHGEKRPFIF